MHRTPCSAMLRNRCNRAKGPRGITTLLAPLILTLGFAGTVSAQQPAPPELPGQLAWTAYNLGTTGYNQSVAIGAMLRDRYNITLRVIPGQNDVSRLLPLVSNRVQFSANGVATYFAQEGVYQFADPQWGPQALQLLMTSNGLSNQAVAVAADTGVTTFAELRGRRVPFVRAAPALNISMEAYLACGGLTWDDVERVDFPGYEAMWEGVINGDVDVAFGTTVSGPTRRLEASPRGIAWLPAPHDDEACWQGMHSVAPYFTRHMATRGPGISDEQPQEAGTYPYPALIAQSTQDEEMVYWMTRVIHENFDDFKDADPGAIGWQLERQVFDWVVPYHAGAVRYWREIGVWTDELEAHNQSLLERQRVLAEAWQEAESAGIRDRDEFSEHWQQLRAQRLEAAGFDPVWETWD
ncbi:MAG: TAXI family TRAP transporter solute-binding subunit [Pseudomonadota bacterium]|nr:TAXI family TRAP transporter solute-binding subunit [Pseudomonadota bacterium]